MTAMPRPAATQDLCFCNTANKWKFNGYGGIRITGLARKMHEGIYQARRSPELGSCRVCEFEVGRPIRKKAGTILDKKTTLRTDGRGYDFHKRIFPESDELPAT